VGSPVCGPLHLPPLVAGISPSGNPPADRTTRKDSPTICASLRVFFASIGRTDLARRRFSVRHFDFGISSNALRISATFIATPGPHFSAGYMPTPPPLACQVSGGGVLVVVRVFGRLHLGIVPLAPADPLHFPTSARARFEAPTRPFLCALQSSRSAQAFVRCVEFTPRCAFFSLQQLPGFSAALCHPLPPASAVFRCSDVTVGCSLCAACLLALWTLPLRFAFNVRFAFLLALSHCLLPIHVSAALCHLFPHCLAVFRSCMVFGLCVCALHPRALPLLAFVTLPSLPSPPSQIALVLCAFMGSFHTRVSAGHVSTSSPCFAGFRSLVRFVSRVCAAPFCFLLSPLFEG
jgi:hypothetical protein